MHETPFLVPELWNIRYGFEPCGEIAGICIDGAEHNAATQRDPAWGVLFIMPTLLPLWGQFLQTVERG